MTESRLEMYCPCDVCGGKPQNDMTFTRWQENSWLQYSLCNKHLPKLSPRVWVWMHQWRIGRKLATFLGLGIGYGGCYKCGTPWNCIRSHTTDYTPGQGCFPLCEKCWQELTPEQRLPYYDQLIAAWQAQGLVDSDTIEQIHTAVLEGK